VSSAPIVVSGLSKQYRIGTTRRYRTLRESLVRAAGDAARSLTGHAFGDSRRTLWALKDVGFTVQEGDVVGLIGRNGAGKSTLLKVLSRITEPTAGRVELVGRVGSLLEVGTGFHPELTGRENIFLNGSILGMRRREIVARFDEIVDFAEIEDFLETPVKHYSSGMHVRLAFAVAAHLEPEILLIDEVLAVGDAAFQKKCLGKVRDVARHGRTVLFVSHNMAAVQQLTSTGLWISEGRVAAHGPTAQVVREYLASLREHGGTAVDVDESMRALAGQKRPVEFVRIEILGRSTPLIPAGGDIDLLLSVRAAESVARLRFSATLARSDGVAVGSAVGHEAGSIQAGERAAFRMRLSDLRLAPGLYQLALGVGIGDDVTGRRDFDVVRDILPFEVLGAADDAAGEWHADRGSIRFTPPEVTRVS
jgi:lipopolysaccharide transport system ATP-binding protein